MEKSIGDLSGLGPKDSEWLKDAKCRGGKNEIFFPEGESDRKTREAGKAVCQLCEVREECLKFALDTKSEYGTFGGYDQWERRELQRRYRVLRSKSDRTEFISRMAAARGQLKQRASHRRTNRSGSPL